MPVPSKMPLPTSSDLDVYTKVCGVRGYGEDGSGDIWQNGPKSGVDEVNKVQRVDGLNSPEIGFVAHPITCLYCPKSSPLSPSAKSG
jgi:hypothetical protein